MSARTARPVVFCVLVGAVLACSYAALVLHLRRSSLAERSKQAANIAFLLAEETDRSFQSLDLVLKSMIAMLKSQGVGDLSGLRNLAGEQVRETLAAAARGLPHITNVSVVDAEGRILVRSRPGPVSDANLSSRDYFLAQKSALGDESFVSKPAINYATNSLSLFVSRRISGRDGSFLGVVVGVFDPSSFASTYEKLGLDQQVSTIILQRIDGVLLSRYPRSNRLIGRTISDVPSFDRLVATRRNGTVQEVSPVDGIDKIVSVVNLPHYPLAQLVTLSVPLALSEWRSVALVLGFAALLLYIAIVLVVLLAARHADERSRAETALVLADERERADKAFRQEHTRFEIALRNMRQGLAMYDASGRLILCNNQYAEMYKLHADLTRSGTSIEEVLAHRSVVRTGRADQGPLDLLKSSGRVVHRLHDGRTICVVRQPLSEGGWVSTHEDITEQQAAEERIRHLAGHDPLTGLPNRLLFQETLRARLSGLQQGVSLGLLYIDLDRFKPINDTFGHEVGDAVLIAVVKRLVPIIRDGDMLARIGGDEFALLFTFRGNARRADKLAGRVGRALSGSIPLPNGADATLGASIGISIAPRDTLAPDQLIRNADIAMYHAKAVARGTVSFFDPEMEERLRLRRKLEEDLRRAVETNEFVLHYQPQVDLRSGDVVAFEALLRWNHPEHGLVAPSNFIATAEELGLIVRIGEWVLREASMEAARWPSRIKVAVNLSAIQFERPGLVELVRDCLDRGGLMPERLELEITESVLVREPEHVVSLLDEFRKMGISVAMDDFGTGYSSMSYLRLFPFDKLKIDKSFVADLATSADCRAIVRASASLATSLGMKTTAEGIETAEQVRMLLAQGCTHGQGYLFGRPAPAIATRALLGVATLAA